MDVAKDEFIRLRREVREIDKTSIGLGNLTNDAQVKKIASCIDGNLIAWDGTAGDRPKDSGIPALGLAREYLTLLKTNGSQNVGTTDETVVTFNTSESVGGANLLERDGNGIKAKTSCYAEFDAMIAGADFAADKFWKFRIRLNGTLLTQATAHRSSSGSTAIGGSLHVPPVTLSAGDIIDLSCDSDDNAYYIHGDDATGRYWTYLTGRAWAR